MSGEVAIANKGPVMPVFYFVAFALFAGALTIGLKTGSVWLGGSPWKPHFIHRRENLTGYIVVMLLLGGGALFALSEGVAELR